MSERSASYRRIYAAARRVPRGSVATYGQIADLAGLPGHARQVGYALHALREEDDVPWHRIINARGEVSPRSEPGMDDVQRVLLEQEGVTFDARGRVDLSAAQWKPGLNPGRKGAGRKKSGARGRKKAARSPSPSA